MQLRRKLYALVLAGAAVIQHLVQPVLPRPKRVWRRRYILHLGAIARQMETTVMYVPRVPCQLEFFAAQS